MTNKDQCREAFEKWFSKYHDEACREWGGIDCTNPKGVAEEAWQAARSAPAAPMEMPEPIAQISMASTGHIEWRHGLMVREVTPLDGQALYTEQQVRELLAAAPKLPQGDCWLPIESAPKDGSEILLVSRKCRIANGCWMTANDKVGAWMWPYVLQEPTHWMPLPQPPQEEG